MRYLAWVIMAAAFLGTWFLTQDLIMAFAAQFLVLFVMLVMGKQFFFGVQTNPDLVEEEEEPKGKKKSKKRK